MARKGLIYRKIKQPANQPTNRPVQAESLLYNREQAAGDIGLYMNANKIEFMCFKQEGALPK